jgi:competence protein ComFC
LQSLTQEEGLPYHDPRVQALVWELKYRASRRARALAGEFLAETLLALAAEELGRPLLVPVPMHPVRRRARGHNQTELLCKAALKSLGGALEYAPQALKRIKDTPTQQGLERSKRLQNVKNSMQGERAAVRGRVCVVVDDVTTTGATLEECKRALKQAGARRVHLVALARS